jgi:hypothetical protein
LVLESWSFASYFHRLCFVFRRSNNMLYPREDKETRTLLYACQTCEHEVDPLFVLRFVHYFPDFVIDSGKP